ncbi:hypothetical protein AZE42_12900, partial [Rhizopogon vesiculosus]
MVVEDLSAKDSDLFLDEVCKWFTFKSRD